MATHDTPFSRLQTHWVYGGFLAGLLLLALAPIFADTLKWAEFLTFLTLPAYMLHQFEEHENDRFRRFFNAEIGKGREVLTIADVFVINVPGVWGVLAITIWLNQTVGLGWGLIAFYAILINALAHIGQAAAIRRSNPGLWTAILIFLPLGIAGLVLLSPLASVSQQLVSLSLAILIHVLIIARVRHAFKKAAP